ncbi:MAG TPA: hypothetical protein VFN39_03000, partial [Gemmatimonadaceae bacterium]|nr:hypothetical protein [Gemmatimonadaceae bacterium]
MRHPARWVIPALAAALLLPGCRARGAVHRVAIGLAVQAQSVANLSTKQGAELAIARLNEQRPRGAPAFVLRTLPPN